MRWAAVVARGLRDALGTASLRRLQAAWFASQVGNWASFVALSVYAYGVGGASAVGLAALARMLPAALAAPAMGLLGDRHSRRDVLVTVTAGRTATLALTSVAVGLRAPAGVVFALAAAYMMLGTVDRPPGSPGPLVGECSKAAAAANSLSSTIDNGAFLIGSLVGGLVVAAWSVQAAFGVTAGALLLATGALAAIPRDTRPAHAKPLPGDNLAHEAAEGLRVITADPGLRLAVGVLAGSTLAEGAIDVLVVVVALQLLDLGPAGLGWLNAGWGLGGMLGGAGTIVLLVGGRLVTCLVVGSVLVGAPLVVLAGVPAAGVAGAGLVVLGVGFSLVEVAGLVLVQRLAGDAVLARVFAVIEGSYQLTTGLGSITAPLVVALLGVRGALVVVGFALPVLVLARWRALGRFPSAAPVAEREFQLLRGIDMFMPLPLATAEQLARRMTAVRKSAGQWIVREGEPGDRFYVIASGTVEVLERGVLRRVQEPGDSFGEIALLRDVPRTATVLARGDVELFALERQDFLAAVTGDRHALAAAHEVAASRLAPQPSRRGPGAA